MPLKVTLKINSQLEEPFMYEEITKALFLMWPTKALGPVGLYAIFFQKHWANSAKWRGYDLSTHP